MVMGELPVEADVAVIGGGPGGYAAAFRAADLGFNVSLVTDEPQLGGVCLLRGCIPSKALLSLTELIHTARVATARGISFGDPQIDLDTLRAWKEKVIQQLAGGLHQLCERRGIQLVQARATFTGPDSLHLQDAEAHGLTFKHAIIATGSRPIPLPGINFSDRIMDSRAALELKDIPEKLLVIGGGYVGLELGMVYASLGSQVTLVEMADRLMPQADADLVKPLARVVQELFAGVYLKTKVAEVKAEKKKMQVALHGEAKLSDPVFDRVLVAIGRRPSSDDLGLETTKVERNEQGSIIVDEQRRTTDPHIFAVGDVAGGMLLAHEAMHEGKVAAEVIAGHPAAFDARAIPAVVYTDPQIAWCGLTEQEAQAQGREVKVARFPWRASGRAVSMGAVDGFTKVIMDPGSQRVLGVGIVGRHAEALIAEGVLAVEMGAVAQDLALTIHPHPTLSETIGEAAELFQGGATHAFLGKGSR
ncbi:MAG TPA: dihydrolipoyl dehydrogenase [Candidatus Binatia bacterium]|nr:dihydrolipoyl dehydrogenase [Candidatus Binatia bacterium]